MSTKNNLLISTSKMAIIILSTIFFTACKGDNEDVSPEERIPFLGSYRVVDKNSEEDQSFHFTLDVIPSEKANRVELKGFRYVRNGVYATIKESQMNIFQTLEDKDEKVEITGQGTLTGNTLNYSYKIVLKEKGKPTEVFENTAIATKVE